MQVKKLIAVTAVAGAGLFGASQVNAYASKTIYTDPWNGVDFSDTQVTAGQVLTANLDFYLGDAVMNIKTQTNVPKYLSAMSAKCKDGTTGGPGTKTATTKAGGAQKVVCWDLTPVMAVGVIDVQ